jgi:hypothetical protein
VVGGGHEVLKVRAIAGALLAEADYGPIDFK